MKIEDIKAILKIIPLNITISLELIEEIYKWQTKKQKLENILDI